MIAYQLCWLLLAVCLAGLTALSGNAALLALLTALILIPLGQLPFHFWIRKRLKLSVEAPVNLAKGRSASAAILVGNPTALPIQRLLCRVEVENLLNGEKTRIVLHSCVPARQTQRMTVDVGSARSGTLQVRLASVRLYDCFGLLPVSVNRHASRKITVQPDTFETKIAVSAVSDLPEDSDRYAPDRPGPDRSEPFQIREYQRGDSVRQIHWKLSTKLDRLVIREPSLPVVRSILVFWERTEPAGQSAARTDAQAEALVSVCKSLLDQQAQFVLGWNNTAEGSCVLQQISSMEELSGILPRLLAAKSEAEGVSGARLLMQTLGGAPWNHVIYVTTDAAPAQAVTWGAGRLTVLQCAEAGREIAGRVYRFDPKNYAAQLAELEV